MINDFQNEMQRLHAAAKSFSQQYPQHTALLNLTSGCDPDPAIARLFEGFAYLTSQLKQKIDDDVPELAETLLQQLCPQMLRPFPAATIIQFAYQHNYLQSGNQIKKGTMLASNAIAEHQVVCQFQTTADVQLLPIKLLGVDISQEKLGATKLTLKLFAGTEFIFKNLALQRLNIYLHGQSSNVNCLYQLLTSKIKSVCFMEHDKKNKLVTPISESNQNAISALHLTLEDSMIPDVTNSHPGFHLLQEYFSFPEKYHFVALDFSDVVWSDDSHNCDVEIIFDDTSLMDLAISTDNFKLYCAPAINLYQQTSEPIFIDHLRSEYRLYPDVNHTEAVQLYKINNVDSSVIKTGNKKHYYEFSRQDLLDSGKCFYQLSQQYLGAVSEYFLRLRDVFDTEEEYLSCDMLVHNAHIASQCLYEKSLMLSDYSLVDIISATNLLRPSQFCPNKNSNTTAWRLLALLNMNSQVLKSVDDLQYVLRLLDCKQDKKNQRMIKAIHGFSNCSSNQFISGIFYHGLQLHLQVKEEGFVNQAEIYLFGQIFRNFLCDYVAINHFIELTIECLPSNRILQWPPMLGNRQIL